MDKYEGLMRSLEILADDKAMQSIRKSIKDAGQGKSMISMRIWRNEDLENNGFTEGVPQLLSSLRPETKKQLKQSSMSSGKIPLSARTFSKNYPVFDHGTELNCIIIHPDKENLRFFIFASEK